MRFMRQDSLERQTGCMLPRPETHFPIIKIAEGPPCPLKLDHE